VALSIGFKNSVSFLLAIQATRLLTFCLGGTKDYFPLNTPALAGRTLRPGTSPHALRIPPRDGHPALRSSNFALRPASRYSRFWIWGPSSEHQRDFNPPEQCAAQRTLWPLLTSGGSSPHLAMTVALRQTTRISPGIAHPPSRLSLSDLRRNVPCNYWALHLLACSPRCVASIRWLFVRAALCLLLPPHSTSPWTPLPFS